MKTLIGFEEIEDKIITLRGQKVLLDRDVATLYGVETKRVNTTCRMLPKSSRNPCWRKAVICSPIYWTIIFRQQTRKRRLN